MDVKKVAQWLKARYLRAVQFGRQPEQQQGQTLVILTFSIIGLLALVGLVTDGGLIYVHYGHLRRAIDAAAISAANQYREGRGIEELYTAAVETVQLQLGGVHNVRVYWCNHREGAGADTVIDMQGEGYDPHDPDLCSNENHLPRKRMRVEGQLEVQLAFLRIALGEDPVMLGASAESEAAVLNLVLLLDTSESMAYDSCDPSLLEPDFFACLEACRATGNCQPFDSTTAPTEPSVRWAASKFVESLMRDGVDRVAVYHFDKVPVAEQSVEVFQCAWPLTATVRVTVTPSSGRVISLTTNKQLVLDAIDQGQGNPSDPLNIYIRPKAEDPATGVSCAIPSHVGGSYGQDTGYPESQGYGYRWASTNIGGGLREAISELVNNGSTDAAVWVIVLLSDGAANSTDQMADSNGWWSCPSLAGQGGPNYRNYLSTPPVPFCRDPESDGVVTRHCPSQEICDRGDPWYTNPGHVYNEWLYDADDYARDIADLASSQGIAIYSIGFGPYVKSESRGRPDAGERLLRYIADVGDDGDLKTAPCGSDYYWDDVVVDPVPAPGEDCGNYYYTEDASGLQNVFEDIASRIFSRLTR
mgnify:CR=1 FL=1